MNILVVLLFVIAAVFQTAAQAPAPESQAQELSAPVFVKKSAAPAVGVYPQTAHPPTPYSLGLTECVQSALEGPLVLQYEPVESAPTVGEMFPYSEDAWESPGVYQMGDETAWVVKVRGTWALIWVWGEARGWVRRADIMPAPCP